MDKLLLLLLAVALSSTAVLALMEEDIMLTPEQQATLEVTANPADPFAPQNAVVRNQRSLWPSGVIPYLFDNLNSQAVSAIRAAMDDYTRMTCISFRQRTMADSDYVRFFAGSGCFSFIGRIGGPQDISIGRGCESKGIVIHEIFHALGRWHEQSRPDRDSYVRILPENIQSGTESNFDITNPSFVTTQGVSYDLGSIMHYRSRAFSRNGQPTILPIDSSVSESSLGQRNGLSARDLQHVMTLYCGGGSGGSWSSWSSWTGCSQTCNGGSRSRTRSCVGGTTCEGSNVMVEQCNTQACPVPASWGSWSTYGACSTSCGGGRQRRTRSCVGGNTCVGIMSQFRDCNTQACPEPATWASWSSWSACSKSCQGGFRQRNRMCRNGNTCPGSAVDSETCNSNVPCVTQPVTTEWSSWSSCNAECGGGERFRTRNCSTSGCPTIQTQDCNTQDCRPEPKLLGVKHHGCWYLNTQIRRIGSLERTTEALSDEFRTRENPVSKCGLAAMKFNFSLFALTYGGLCASGSNDLQDYQYFRSRLCQDGRGSFNRGWYIMDVYEVTDQQSFDSSAAQALNITTTATTAQMGNSTQEVSNSGYRFAYSIITMFATLILAAAAL